MNQDRLRRLLHETVDDLAPDDRLEEIREGTRTDSGFRSRRAYAGLAAAAVATAAVVGTVAWAGGSLGSDPVVSPADQASEAADTTPPPEPTPSEPASPDPTPSEPARTEPTQAPEPSGSGSPEPATEEFTAALYWLGDTARGARLYREFQRVTGSTELAAAVDAAIAGAPDDPDYRTPWPDTDVVSATADGGVIRIGLDAAPAAGDAANSTEASLALEQVVRTAQAAAGARLPVQFLVDGSPVAEVFGEPTAEPVSEGEWSEVLSLVSLSDPAEGTTVNGDALAVAGVASSFEAHLDWRILRDGSPVADGFFTADGWMGRLHPFDGEIDVAGLAPGSYVLEVTTSDPSGGEGPGPFRDTRSFSIP